MDEILIYSHHWLKQYIIPFAFVGASVFGVAAVIVARIFGGGQSNLLPTHSPDIHIYRPVRFFHGLLVGGGSVVWIIAVLLWEDFTYHDNFLLLGPLRGNPQYIPPPIWPDSGRFWPLGHQEFQYLALIDTSGFVYRLFAVLQFFLLCVASIFLIRLNFLPGLVMVFGIISSSGILISFISLIIPERNLVFLLTLFIFFQKSFLESRALIYLFLSVSISFLMLLYKETAFVLTGGIGAFLVISSIIPRRHTDASLNSDDLKVSGFFLCVGAFLFVAYYLVAIYPFLEESYLSGRSTPFADVLSVFSRHLFSWMLLGLFFIRLLLVTSRADVLEPLWDGLLIVGLFYLLALASLGLSTNYYTAPAALLTWLCAFHFYQRILNVGKQIWLRRLSLFGLVCAVGFQIPEAWHVYVSRKENVAAKSTAAQFISQYGVIEGLGKKDAPIVMHTLFDEKHYSAAINRYFAVLFADFIEAKYKIHIVTALDHEAVPGAEDHQCVPYLRVRCQTGRQFAKNDLVVALNPLYDKDLIDPIVMKKVFVSENIGFWENWFKVEIFQIVGDESG